MQHLSRPSIPTVTRPEQQSLQREASQAAHMAQQHQQHASSHSSRPALAPSLRWLQFCLLLLFGHDVLCFSLGYPFLPSVFGGAATGAAFSCYGLASIAVLLLLLFFSGSNSQTSNSSSSSNPISQVNAASAAAASKFWRIVSAATLAAAAGAANTVLPSSFPMLLLTKATQGAASALYFCDSLSLVAAVYPRAYRTQAMAFISAGLTVGDALGPVVGGLVFQTAGLQAALGLQPAASLAAVLAWGLLLLWGRDARPWNVRTAAATPAAADGSSAQCHVQGAAATEVEAGTASDCRGYSSSYKAMANNSVLEPLLASEQAAAYPTAVMAAWINSATAAAGAQQTASAAVSKGLDAAPAAGRTSRLQLLQQLLQHPAILSLCALALLAQAARTAVDLLLPIMLQGYVQPGVIGLLFAGEAVGSVVAPFFADWLLRRHTSKPSKTRQEASSSGDKYSSSSHVSSSSTEYASWLLLLSTVGMALCCAAVLTAWQLPAALRTAPSVGTAAVQPPGTVHTSFAVQRAVGQLSAKMHSAAAGTAATAVVGVGSEGVLLGWAELLVIAFVLMLLGSCHSSCETLIYTVLTDVIAPSESETERLSDISAVAQPSEGTKRDVNVTCCQYSSCHDSFEESGKSDGSCRAQLPCSTNSFDCAEQQFLCGVGASSDCSARSAVQAHGGSVSTEAASMALEGSGLWGTGSDKNVCVDAASVAACADTSVAASGSLEYDLQVQVGDRSFSSCSTKCSHCDLSDLHVQSNGYSSSGRHVGDQSHTCAIQQCESEPESDCTEVVMVLYVLFWVVGFSVGAGVVGVLPGTELGKLQAGACMLAALLAGVGRWTWLAVSC